MTDDRLTEQARGLRDDIAGLRSLAERMTQSERTVQRTRRITIALGLVVAVGAVSTCYLIILGRRIDAFSRCQAAVNEVTVARSRALTEITAQEREAERARGDALDAVFLDPALLKPVESRTPEDTKRIRALFSAYLETAATLKVERAAADKARAANPVPALPSQLCGP